MQYYFFRYDYLRHLRAAQFVRYYTQHEAAEDRKAPAVRTDENTIGEDDEGAIPDDPAHRNFDALSSRYVEPCSEVPCAPDLHVRVANARRRRNRDFGVARHAFLEPCGAAGEEAFYEQRLLQGLPWHCYKKPCTVRVEEREAAPRHEDDEEAYPEVARAPTTSKADVRSMFARNRSAHANVATRQGLLFIRRQT